MTSTEVNRKPTRDDRDKAMAFAARQHEKNDWGDKGLVDRAETFAEFLADEPTFSSATREQALAHAIELSEEGDGWRPEDTVARATKIARFLTGAA